MEDKILIIDIETTHVSHTMGAIVEIGATELNIVTMEVKKVFDEICHDSILSAKHRREPYGWIFENSTLTPEMVRDAPSLEHEILPKLQELIDLYPLGVTAFNRKFDVTYLHSRGIKFGKLQPCPMLELAPIMNLPHKNGRKGKWPKVTEVYFFYLDNKEYDEEHRAGQDSYDEAIIVSEMIKRGHYKLI